MSISLTRANADQVSSVTYRGHLIIFTSFYEQRGFAPYIHSLAVTAMVLERMGISWDYWPTSGDFHVERAVNQALTRFLADEKATDFLCIDSDESWNADGLLRLISRPDDIVGGLYRMKNRWHEWTGGWLVENGVVDPSGKTVNGVPAGKEDNGEPMIAASALPFGFIRLKKAPLLAYQKAFPDRWYWHDGEKVTQFLTTAIRDHEFFSQDINFCLDMKELGFPLWIEPNVTIGHCGLVEHIGNLHASLCQQHAERQRTPMENIEAFAKSVKEVA